MESKQTAGRGLNPADPGPSPEPLACITGDPDEIAPELRAMLQPGNALTISTGRGLANNLTYHIRGASMGYWCFVDGIGTTKSGNTASSRPTSSRFTSNRAD